MHRGRDRKEDEEKGMDEEYWEMIGREWKKVDLTLYNTDYIKDLWIKVAFIRKECKNQKE